jgi:hypothetical protein
MTGRGEGYCILELPEPDRPARGYAGLEGTRVHLGNAPARLGAQTAWLARWPPRAARRPLAFGRRRGWAARRVRRSWSPR